MITHDYHCSKCQLWVEIRFDSHTQFVRSFECECGGALVQTWRQAPGLSGCSEPGQRGIDATFRSGYDVQAGRYFYDRAERDKYLKKRGLIGLGPQEFERSLNASVVDPEPKFEGLETAIKEAYEENAAGKVSPHLVVDAKTLNPTIAK